MKSREDLIARSETLEAQNSSLRARLYEEHGSHVALRYSTINMSEKIWSDHKKNLPDCPVCSLLSTTNPVAP